MLISERDPHARSHMPRFVLLLILTWLYIAIAGLISLPVLLTPYGLTWLYAEARVGVGCLFRLAGIKLEFAGREALPRHGRVVYMANHQSFLDPPALLLAMPGPVSFLAKQDLFRVPLLGWVMRRGDFVPVNREDREQARQSVQRAAEQVRQGRPLLVFPEGTRSADGTLLPFRMGVFQIAAQAEAMIIPVTIQGTRNCLARKSWRLHPGSVRITIHSPIPARPAPDLSPLAEQVKDVIASSLSESIAI